MNSVLTKALKNKCTHLSLQYLSSQGIFINISYTAGRKFSRFKEPGQTSGQCVSTVPRLTIYFIMVVVFIAIIRVSLYSPGDLEKAILIPQPS